MDTFPLSTWSFLWVLNKVLGLSDFYPAAVINAQAMTKCDDKPVTYQNSDALNIQYINALYYIAFSTWQCRQQYIQM